MPQAEEANSAAAAQGMPQERPKKEGEAASSGGVAELQEKEKDIVEQAPPAEVDLTKEEQEDGQACQKTEVAVEPNWDVASVGAPNLVEGNPWLDHYPAY